MGEVYTEKIDMWSAGCISILMVTGHKPFENKNIAKLYSAILAADIND